MTPGPIGAVRVIAVGIVVLGLPVVAYANHPAGRVDVWIGLLVLGLPSLAVWVVSRLIDRRRTRRIRASEKDGSQKEVTANGC